MNQKRMVLVFLMLSCIGLLSVQTVFSQSAPDINTNPNTLVLSRKLGDQMLGFNAGVYLPLFTHNPNTGVITPQIGDPDGMTLGGSGTLRWGAFLNSIMNLGLDLSWSFNFGPNDDLVSQFTPITARLSTYLRTGSFEFPIHVGVGLNVLSYKITTTLTPVVKLGVSGLYNISPDWGFGLNLMYWWVPDIYGSSTETPPPADTRFGNFLEISLSAIYNF